MRLLEITNPVKSKWRPQAHEFYFVGSNGNSIDPKDQQVIKTHVKPVKEPRSQYDHYVVRYNDSWYLHTKLDPRIQSFEDLMDIVKKYFAIGSVKPANRR